MQVRLVELITRNHTQQLGFTVTAEYIENSENFKKMKIQKYIECSMYIYLLHFQSIYLSLSLSIFSRNLLFEFSKIFNVFRIFYVLGCHCTCSFPEPPCRLGSARRRCTWARGRIGAGTVPRHISDNTELVRHLMSI